MALGFLPNSVHRFTFLGLVLAANLFGQSYDEPDEYYNAVESLLGSGLKDALHNIIDGHVVASYNNVRTAFKELDKDPQNPNNVILIYSGDSVSGSSTSWNREHLWPQSFGADDGPAYTDAHHLFPANASTNSDRSNYAFDELEVYNPLANAPESRVNDNLRLVEPRDEDKGRIARVMFYMDTRYDSSNQTGDFKLSDLPNSGNNRMGKLSTLIKWNREFPPDEYERRRNHLIYEGVRVGNVVVFQGNRNPFVDHPELVDAVYTADDYLTWGSWHIQQFSFYELGKPFISDPLADPDEDDLINFMEFALQKDPLVATMTGLPEVDRDDAVNFFMFSRIKEPEHSYLSYHVEFSSSPLDEDSWQEIPFSPRDLLAADRGQYEDVSLLHTPPTGERDAYYRLTVVREVPGADVLTETFDPALHDVGRLNLFTYTEGIGGAWRWSDWIGEVQPEQAPWYYQMEHEWLYSESTDDQNVWFHDTALGWLHTSYPVYPFMYSANLQDWLYHMQGSLAPDRNFFVPSSGLVATESELLNN